MKKVKAIVRTLNSGVSKLWFWTCERFKDLFYATGNENLELSRVATGILTLLAIFSVFWNTLYKGESIPIGELLNGLAAFSVAAGIGIAAKDWVRNKVTQATEKKNAE